MSQRTPGQGGGLRKSAIYQSVGLVGVSISSRACLAQWLSVSLVSDLKSGNDGVCFSIQPLGICFCKCGFVVVVLGVRSIYKAQTGTYATELA